MWLYQLPSGIRHSAMLGWVKAARWHGYKAFEFLALDGDEQAFLVAAYETAMQCEAVEAHEATKPRGKP